MGSQSQLNYLQKNRPTLFYHDWRRIGFAGNIFILVVYLITSLSVLQISQGKSHCSASVRRSGDDAVFIRVCECCHGHGTVAFVGAPLPMISYGGTAMLTVFVAFGVVMSASIHDRLN